VADLCYYRLLVIVFFSRIEQTMHVAGHAYNLLSAAELGLLHRSALHILHQAGLEVQDERLLRALREIGAQIDCQEERARFPPSFVERFLADIDAYDWKGARPQVRGSAGIYHGLYHDPARDELVPWNEERLAYYISLSRNLGRVGGAHMLGCRLPAPGPLEPLYERYYCWKYGATESGSIHRDELCPYLLDMYQALAGERQTSLAQAFKGTVYLVPPLKLGRHEAYQVAYFWERGLRVHIGGGMGTLGATAPATLAGAVALNLAEQIALSILEWALYGKKRLHLSAGLAVMDMRTMIRPYGRPEMAIANLMTAQLARYYGASFSGQAGLSDAKLPSVEAGAQKALTALPTLLAGGSVWIDAGLLAIDEVCSPIQMILDEEWMGAMERCTHEFEISEESIGLQTILEAGPGGHFLDKLHTARYFRDEHWNPGIWSRQMLGPWLAGDRRLDVDHARERALDVLSEKRRQGPGPDEMSHSLEKHVVQIIDRARHKLHA
jgi:trimethylamine--corrinoid protein Co-methyltransferase